MTRVVFVLPDLRLAGAQTRTVDLAEGLAADRVDVDVLVLLRSVHPALERRLSDAGITVTRLLHPMRVGRLLHTLATRERPVVHAAMPTAGVVGLLLARLTRGAFVYSYTNCLHRHRPFTPLAAQDAVKTFLEALLAHRSDALHAVSESVGLQLARTYPRAAGRTHILRHGPTMPGSDASGSLVPAPPLTARPRLLCVSRLTPHKRVRDALGATAALKAKYPDVHLVVLGAGPEHHVLRSLAHRLKIAENVSFTGSTPNVDAFYEWADILLHPSLYEGYPRTFAEAVAKRLPVVSANAPYAREGHTPGHPLFLARPMDPGSLADGVVGLLGARCGPPTDVGGDAHRMAALYRTALGLAAP
ncbi:glycosyltransferase [Streptomyces sp. NPDC096176]|uniref:glycosyltransferase n=1 Tax=Streptomyces sp. NPDC096176 TaxID=3366079 RepID=UPI0038020FD9